MSRILKTPERGAVNAPSITGDPMLANLRTENDTAVIRLTGRFDFSGHREFKHCYEAALEEPSVRRIDVDLRAVEYLDSSALGMLLLLREQADARSLPVSLLN